MKTCRICKETKPITEFYKDPTGKDGHFNHCIMCQSKKAKKYRQTEEYRISQRRYRQSEKGKIAYRAKAFRFRIRHPERRRAKEVVYYAIQTGKLPRPDSLLCHYCPKPAQLYHHWHGYAPKHRLDVVPVCTDCHYKCKKKIAV